MNDYSFITPMNVHHIYGGSNTTSTATSYIDLLNANNDTSSFTIEPDVVYV